MPEATKFVATTTADRAPVQNRVRDKIHRVERFVGSSSSIRTSLRGCFCLSLARSRKAKTCGFEARLQPKNTGEFLNRCFHAVLRKISIGEAVMSLDVVGVEPCSLFKMHRRERRLALT